MKKLIALLCTITCLCSTVSVRAQWEMPRKISIADTSAGLNENMGQCLAVAGDSVHAVWVDYANKQGRIFYAHSYDNGTTWSTGAQISGTRNSAGFPSISVSGRFVHVAYRDTTGSSYESWYVRSSDAGMTWSAPVSLGKFYWWPSITSDGASVYVALNDNLGTNSEVFFRRSLDNGITWDTVVRISNAAGRSEDPSIAASDGFVYLVWNDNRTGIMQTWFRRSTDNGVTWENERQLSNSPTFAYFPMVHAVHEKVDVVYGDRASSNFEVYYTGSSDNGLSFSKPSQITHSGATSAYPVLTRVGTRLALVYWIMSADAFVVNSSDDGSTWSTPSMLVPKSNTPSSPFIVATPAAEHIIYVDQREGHKEIYYTRLLATTNDVATVAMSDQRLMIAYPNPAHRHATIVVENASRVERAEITLFDEAGQKILTHNLGPIEKGKTEIPIDLSNAAQAIYGRLIGDGRLLGECRISNTH